MVDPKQFDEYRDKLIRLTEEADRCVTELAEDVDFKNYFGNSPAEIRHSLSVLKENIFPVALFAKMQSGKSTTTAALADGREITPCGKGGGGLRTSTVSVTIYNDDNVQEVKVNGVRTTPVKINLYSNQELVKCILDAAGGILKDKDPNSYNPDNPKDMAFLKQCIEFEIEVYKGMKKHCRRDQQSYSSDKLAALREAILILAFYGSDAHKNLLAGKFSTIAGMQSFLKAGEWESKWERLAEDGFDKTVKNFTAEESLHVFIESVKVPVKSDFMRKTATSVTDAPGTMANFRDTERALKAARESAIILFVLNGDKQFTQEEENQLIKLNNSGMSDKIIFAVNFMDRTPKQLKTVGIERSIVSVLREKGFTAPHHQNFLYYNAYLALHVFQGEMIVDGTFDPISKQALLEDAEQMDVPHRSVEEAWKYTTASALNRLNNSDLADEVKRATLTDKENFKKLLQRILAFSRWNEMILSLRAHILQNRASSILLNLGAAPVVMALESIEQALQSREETGKKELDAIEAQYAEAKRILDEFSESAQEVLSREFTDSIDKALADYCYEEVVLRSADDAAAEAAPEIYELTSLTSNAKSAFNWALTSIGNIFRDKNHQKVHVDIKQRCINIFSNYYKEAVTIRGTAWSETLEQSDVYIRYVQRTVKNVQSDLQQIWKKSQLQNNELLDNITPVPSHLTGSIRRDVELSGSIIENLDPAMAAKFEILSMMKYMFLGTAVSFIVFSIPIIGQILAVVAYLYYLVESDAEKQQRIYEFEDKLAYDVRGKLDKQRNKIQSDLIDGQPAKYSWETSKPGINVIRKFYEQLFTATIEQQKAELDTNYQRAKADLNRNETELDRIREKAEQFRTQFVAPLRENVAAVKQEIIKIFGGGTDNVEHTV